MWAPKCYQGLSSIRRTIAPSSSSEQEVFPLPGGLRPGRPDLPWAMAVPASAPGLSQKQGLPGFTHCPRGGDSRTCFHMDGAPGFRFPGRAQLTGAQPSALSLYLHSLPPRLSSSPPSKYLSLTYLSLHVSCCCFFGLAFLSGTPCLGDR